MGTAATRPEWTKSHPPPPQSPAPRLSQPPVPSIKTATNADVEGVKRPASATDLTKPLAVVVGSLSQSHLDDLPPAAESNPAASPNTKPPTTTTTTTTFPNISSSTHHSTRPLSSLSSSAANPVTATTLAGTLANISLGPPSKRSLASRRSSAASTESARAAANRASSRFASSTSDSKSVGDSKGTGVASAGANSPPQTTPAANHHPNLQPPKLNIAGVSRPFFPPRSPMSAGTQVGGNVFSAVPMLEPSNIPPWIRKIYELGSGVSGYFEQKYREIEASESDRIRAGQTQRDSPYSLEQAQQRDHMRRNRYFDIIPFDGSRVILQEPSAPENSNYINASHVDGFPGTSKYITSQGPLGNTFGDFWQMVWEQNSRVIVMLTREEERGRTKCDRYWPDSTEQPLDFNNLGGLHLKLLEERSTSEGAVLIRRLHLSHSSHHQASPTTRELWQVHFLNWPDHRASSPYSVLGVMDLVRELQSRSESSGPVGPLVVHCSAGCGRTGTFCAIDTVLSLLEHYPGSDITAETSSLSTSPHSQELDPSTDLVYLSVEKFREARVSMVQTLEQYKFIYEAVVYRILEWQHEIEQNGEASRSRTRRPPWVKPGVGKQRI